MQAFPAIISQMVSLIYNLADTYFVGKLNMPAQSAAVSVAMPVFLLLTAISNLFGVGGASSLSQFLGRKDPRSAGKVASIAFWYGLFSAILFSVLLAPFMDKILILVGADDDTIGLAGKYLFWTVLLGGPATVLNMLLANIVRAEGRSGVASFGVSLGGILNIILDPFFILPQFLNMGAEGAGLATAISNLCGMLFFILYILRGNGTVVSIAPGALRDSGKYLGRILKIGASSALQFTLTVVSASATTKFVSFAGTEAVAAFGIQKKLDQLPLYFSIGMANGLLPIMAYNYAAKNEKRQEEVFRFGVSAAVTFSIAILIAYEAFAPYFAIAFIKDSATVRLITDFLRIQIVAQPLVAVNYPMIVQFQAMGKAKEAMICSLIRKGVLDIPFLFLMNRLIPLYGCLWVQPIVDSLALIVCLYYYRKIRRKSPATVS